MTTALEVGEWSASCPGRTLPPGKTRYPLYRRLGGPQGRSGRAENLAAPGFDPRTVQSVVNRYTVWATRPTKVMGTLCKDLNTFTIISRPDLLRMRNVSHKVCREDQNTRFVFGDYFRKSSRLWDSVEKYCNPDRSWMEIYHGARALHAG